MSPGKSRVLLLLLPFLVSLVGAPLATGATSGGPDEYWITGIHNVTTEEIYEDAILHVNGSILVNPGGRLVLRHTQLIFEGNGSQALGVQLDGELLLESTAAGPTRIDSADAESKYFFSTYGRFEAIGTPEAPVVIRNVTGFASAIAPSATSSGLFFNGLMLIGPHNVLDHVIFLESDAGVGVSSTGQTRISNCAFLLVGVGLYLQYARNVTVDNSYLQASESAVFARRASNITIRDSILEGEQFGLIAQLSQIAVKNTTLSGKAGAAHVIQGGEYDFDSTVFKNYRLAGLKSTVDPRMASAPTSLDVSGATFEGGGRSPVGIDIPQDERTVLRLRDSRVVDHNEDGLSVFVAGYVELANNTFERNGHFGVRIVGAPFVETDNHFGIGTEDANGVGALDASMPIGLRAVDADDAPIPNATINLTMVGGSEVRSIMTGQSGSASPILHALSISNDGVRTESEFWGVATADGHSSVERGFSPYGATPPIDFRLASTAPLDESATSLGLAQGATLEPAKYGVMAAVIVAALAIAAGLAAVHRARKRRL